MKLPSLTNQSTNLTTVNKSLTGKIEGPNFSRGDVFSSTNFNSVMSKELKSSVCLSDDAYQYDLPPDTLTERSENSYVEEDDVLDKDDEFGGSNIMEDQDETINDREE